MLGDQAPAGYRESATPVADPDGNGVFIGDVDPGGQYGWLEGKTGAPLTATLAELLASGERQPWPL